MGGSNTKQHTDADYDLNEEEPQDVSEIRPVNKSNNPTNNFQTEPNSNQGYNPTSNNNYRNSAAQNNMQASSVPPAYNNNPANPASTNMMSQSKKLEAKPTVIQGSNVARQTNQSQVLGQGGYTEEKKTQYVPTNIAAVRNNEMQEDLPQFSQFVKAIVSALTYPVDPSQFNDRSLLPEKFEFTQNSNIFYVFEEERAALVPRAEILKPYMILKEVLSNGWTDEKLPPRPESISTDFSKFDTSKIVWKKLSQVAPAGGFAILYDTNKPTAIIPGMLNNRAFQSALSILAEREGYLSSIFPDFNEKSESIISVWLNQMGEWRAYVLDEFFPYNKDTGKCAFTSTQDETWALVLEKAFAKMYGSYFALEKGHPAHFIHDITGAPYKYFFFEESAKCWQFFMSINRSTTTVIAMNKDPKYRIEDENDTFKPPAYSYAVLDFQEVQTRTGKERLVKLRDPWKEKTWKGDWSSASNKWNEALIKQLCPQGLTDDIFWISIGDFVKNYGIGFSFSVYARYQHCNLRLKHSFQRNYSLLLMNVPKNARMILKVSQADHHYFMGVQEKYAYSCVQMMVIEVDSRLRAKRFITGMHNKGRDCDCEGQFEAGDYLVYVEVDWEQNINRELVFSTYGETNSILYEINCLKEQAELIKLFITQYVISNQDPQKIIDYGYFGDKRVRRHINYIFGYLCFYYENRSDLFGLAEKVRMESLFGLKIMPPFTDNHEFDVLVPANSDLMVIYNSTVEGQLRAMYKHMSWGYLYPDTTDDMLKRLVRAKAKKVIKRKLKDKEVNIFVHIFSFSGGFCFYYVNKTVYTYVERLSLDLYNIVGFDNSEQTYFEIILAPNAECLLKFKVKDLLHPYSYNSRVTYKILAPGSPIPAPGLPNQQQVPKSVSDMLAKQFQQYGNQPGAAQQKQQAQGQGQSMPKPVSDMLSKQFQQYGNQPVPAQQQGVNQSLSKPAADMVKYQLQAYGNNSTSGQTGQSQQIPTFRGQVSPAAGGQNAGAQGMSKPVNDMLAYQMQNYGGSSTASPTRGQEAIPKSVNGVGTNSASPNRGQEAMPPKSVNDMLAYQMQNYGGGANPNNASSPTRGQEAMPKSVNDMMAYQMKTYGNGTPNNLTPSNPGAGARGSQSLPKPLNDMLANHMQNYGGGSSTASPARGQDTLPKPVNDMMAYQMKSHRTSGTNSAAISNSPSYRGGPEISSSPPKQSMYTFQQEQQQQPKPVSDMINRHLQMYGGGNQQQQSVGQVGSPTRGRGSVGNEGGNTIKLNPVNDMLAYQMQNYGGSAESSMSPSRR